MKRLRLFGASVSSKKTRLPRLSSFGFKLDRAQTGKHPEGARPFGEGLPSDILKLVEPLTVRRTALPSWWHSRAWCTYSMRSRKVEDGERNARVQGRKKAVTKRRPTATPPESDADLTFEVGGGNVRDVGYRVRAVGRLGAAGSNRGGRVRRLGATIEQQSGLLPRAAGVFGNGSGVTAFRCRPVVDLGGPVRSTRARSGQGRGGITSRAPWIRWAAPVFRIGAVTIRPAARVFSAESR